MLRISDLITEQMKSGNNYMSWTAVNSENLPQNCDIPVEVADDVVVIGYPRGYYSQL